MRDESGKIIVRRFWNRTLESLLLILAVAMGVGAAASGLSLIANIGSYSKETLASPAYREIIVSTQNNATDMTDPVILKPTQDNVVLTTKDLDAATMVPQVAHAYISNQTELRFINQAEAEREATMVRDGFGGPPPEEAATTGVPSSATAATATAGTAASAGTATAPTAATTEIEAVPTPTTSGTGTGTATASSAGTANAGAATGTRTQSARTSDRPPQERFGLSSAELEVAVADASIIIGQQENLAGYRVTPQFFDAWSMKAGSGSLFTDSDLSGTQSIVVLGSEAAMVLAGEGKDPASLVGKKILARQGYQTVVGILQSTGKAVYDGAYFTPYRSGATGFGGGPPMRSMNTQLRFSVADPKSLTETAAGLTEWFDSQYGEGRIVVSNPRAETERLMARNTGIGLLILFLSLAGLFIASVNVSNILMGRGLRMRKNVGILMALGASRAAIITLFAKEALAISAAGSLLGALLALPLSASMRNALGITGGSWWYLLVGIAAAWVPTIIFSLMPARQNSMIDPAQAMRVA